MDTNGNAVLPVVSPEHWAEHNWKYVLYAEGLICLCMWAAACKGQMRSKSEYSVAEESKEEEELQRPSSDRLVDGIRLTLGHVQKDLAGLRGGGMSKIGFTFGLLNVMLNVAVFSALPEHLWLVFLAKTIFLIPLWWKTVAEMHNGHLFILDFCWCGALYIGLYFALTLAGHLESWQVKSGFLVFYTCGMGPMSWANLMLGNGITFHATIELTSNFIHLSPSLVALALIAFPNRVEDAWPDRFPARDEILACSWAEVYLHGAAFHVVWVTLHGLWLLTVGVTAPDRGYNTVFDWANKKGGWGAMWEKKGVHGVRSHAFLYLLTHTVLSNLVIAIAALMIKSVAAHFVFTAVLVCSAVWAGAGKYQFLIMRKTERIIQKLLEAEEKKEVFVGDKAQLSLFGTDTAEEIKSL